jgi:hypothetical protein
VVKSLGFGVEAFDDIAQTIAPSQLSEDHANQLLANSEMSYSRLGMEALGKAGEGLPMHQIENLCEDVATGIHPARKAKRIPRNSNPSHRISFVSL